MFDGYLAFDGTELINGARTAAYLREMLPQIEVRCAHEDLPAALGHSPYVSPARDGAPWHHGQRTAGARFLGLLPGRMQGAENSSRTVEVTELSGDGAVLTSPGHGALEIRVTATAFALDEEAMTEGLAWVRDTLAHQGCSGADLGCTGTEAKMFAASPATAVQAYSLARTFHRVEATEGPLVLLKHPSKHGTVWEIEFTLTAGIPWPFTSLANIGTLDMDTAVNFQDPAGEDCSVGADPYNDFVADPYFTAISRPPRPPVILPLNILDINSWRRLSLPIPAEHTKRWGRVTPVVHVLAEQETQYLRLRFYEEGASGCAFDGEFIVSYLPAGSILRLDGIAQEATLAIPDGRRVPAGHLLFGSDGRPFLWPSLGCRKDWTMTADLMPGQSGVSVTLDTAIRE